MIARQPRGGRCSERRAQPIHPDPLPQKPADPLIGDTGVSQYREDLLGQREFVLAVFRPLGQLIGQPVSGPGLPRRDGLIEQLHHLVEHIHR